MENVVKSMVNVQRIYVVVNMELVVQNQNFVQLLKDVKANMVNVKNNKEKKTPNFACKLNNYDPNKEISLALGKKNFIGVIGEFIIINKSLKSENINYLFNLRENYANLLCKYYYDYKIPLDGTTTKKTET